MGDILEEMEAALRADGIEAVREQLPRLVGAFVSLRGAMEDAIFPLADGRRGG
jgi:hypothetical protein